MIDDDEPTTNMWFETIRTTTIDDDALRAATESREPGISALDGNEGGGWMGITVVLVGIWDTEENYGFDMRNEF